MKDIFKKHLDIVLVIGMIVFTAVIIACAMWSIGNLAQQAGDAFSTEHAGTPPTAFDIQGAAALDLHGLTPSQTSQ